MRRVTFSLPWPLSAEETRELLQLIFSVALVTYIGLLVLENLQKGFVSSFMDVGWWLWATVSSGTLSILWPYVVPEAKVKPTRSWYDFLWIGLLTIGTVVIVWKKMSLIGWLANVIPPLIGILVLGLALLVYYDRDDVEPGA